MEDYDYNLPQKDHIHNQTMLAKFDYNQSCTVYNDICLTVLSQIQIVHYMNEFIIKSSMNVFFCQQIHRNSH